MFYKVPDSGKKVKIENGKPSPPILPWFATLGRRNRVDIWPATQKAVDAAVAKPTAASGKLPGLRF